MTDHDAALSAIAALKDTAALPFDRAKAMPKAVYTSEAFAAAEREQVFAKEWICLGRQEQLEKTGDYIAAEIAGEPVFVIRNEAGEIRAFSNVCRHRMSTMLDGTGCAQRVRCPYHGWTYGLDGRLKTAAAMSGNKDFDASAHRLPELRVEIWLGWIMVSLDPDAPPLAPRLAELEAEIADLQAETYVQTFSESFLWDTNWKVLAENFMESYHLHVCHAGTIGPTTDLAKMDMVPGAPAFNFHTILKDPKAFLTNAHPENERLSGERRITTYIMAIYPALMITLTPGYFWYLSLQPRGAGKVHVTYAGGMAPEFINDPKGAEHLEAAKSLLDAVNSEDKGCVERVYKGMVANRSAPGELSHLERPLYDFTKYLASRF